MLLMVLGLALAASRAEAQLGCLADVGGVVSCSPSVECLSAGDCAGGELCRFGYCAETTCVPCLPEGASTCPRIDAVSTAVDSAVVSRRCSYRYPCGAVLEVGLAGPLPTNSLCFLRTNRETAALWPEGDCDGDGAPNAAEVDSTTEVCALVVTPSGMAPGGSHLLRQGATPTPGSAAPSLDLVVPGVGVACNGTQRCPDGAADFSVRGRCVYVTDTYGVCLYSEDDPSRAQLPRDDRSCASAVGPRRLPVGTMSRQDLEERDYDRDGLVNGDDPQVCRSLEVVSASGPMLVSTPGVLLTSCSAMPNARVVMPEGRCASSLSSSTHFGVACDMRSDCPVSVSSGLRTEARCVQFPGAGICVYGGGDVPDSTCADVTNVSTCGLGNYSTFVVADCDSDLTINVQDGTMCGVAMSPSDAGIDGGAYADADALDADDALDAVARNDSSVRPPPPTGVSFGGGGGCTCSVRGREPGVGSLLVALGLLGAFWARRRRFTAS